MSLLEKIPLSNWIKWLLPKPQIPQKRYLVMLGMVLYWAAKAYVAYTPETHDDSYPDDVRNVVVRMFAHTDGAGIDETADVDADGFQFGEGVG